MPIASSSSGACFNGYGEIIKGIKQYPETVPEELVIISYGYIYFFTHLLLRLIHFLQD
jgi:hypothetical protein